MLRKTGAVALSITFASAASAAHADFLAGRNAWLNNEPHLAISEWTPLAVADDPIAQCYLGALYGSGGRFLVFLPGPGDQGPGEAESGNIEPDADAATAWFAKAAQSLGPRAESGEPHAQFCLAYLHLREMIQKHLPAQFHVRTGFPQDAQIADKLLLEASNQGLAEAQMLYSLPSTNTEEGFKLLLLAAEQDYPEAVAYTILIYNMNMLGSTPNLLEQEDYDVHLFKWLERGANLGIRSAQDFLARFYAIGNSRTGMEADLAKAYFWYLVAGPIGEPRSPALETLFGSRSAVEDSLSLEQREEAERLARLWVPKRF